MNKYLAWYFISVAALMCLALAATYKSRSSLRQKNELDVSIFVSFVGPWFFPLVPLLILGSAILSIMEWYENQSLILFGVIRLYRS